MPSQRDGALVGRCWRVRVLVFFESRTGSDSVVQTDVGSGSWDRFVLRFWQELGVVGCGGKFTIITIITIITIKTIITIITNFTIITITTLDSFFQ